MHELGIVFHVIDAVKEVAAENDAKHVNSVTVEIGEVSLVIPSYFEDCWKWAVSKHEIMTDCQIKIDILPAVTYCEDCQKTYPTVEFGKKCPHCGSDRTYLQTGNEFNIKEIEVV